MMFETRPTTYDAIKDWGWDEFKPYTDKLNATEITADNIHEWLVGFRETLELLMELGQRSQVATTQNTNDAESNKRFMRFNDEIRPQAMMAIHQLNIKWVESGIVPDGMDIPLKKIQSDIELFREENLPLLGQESNLTTEYNRIIGAQTVQWDGKEVTLPQLSPVFLEVDRDRREKAWHLSMERRLQDRDTLNDLWRQFLDIRRQIAKNADMEDYRAYKWKELKRFDYTPDDALAFFDAIEETVVPVLERLMDKRRQQMGLETLRPWDTSVDTQGREPLRPFEDVQTLKDKTVDIFNTIDPALGEYVRIMRDESYLDLDNRKGKAPGGYCTFFPLSKRPFIFMNAVGTHDDLQTMLHESGHAFHMFEVAELPYEQQVDVPMEFSEVASMSMELLAAPYIEKDKGGFYTPAESARARIDHLSTIVYLWAYIAVVARFQHWVYTHIDDAYDPEKCDDQWETLWNRYMKGIDYSGLEQYKRIRWQSQVHIYEVPFYYIEYGIAQLGSVQIWANSLKDHEQALKNYRKALALGGTVSLSELYETAGAKLAFDADTFKEAITLIETTIAKLEAIE